VNIIRLKASAGLLSESDLIEINQQLMASNTSRKAVND